MTGINYFSVFFDVEFEYEVSFSLAIAVSVAEGGTIIFWDPVFDRSRKQLWAKGAKAPSETSEKLSVDLLALGLSKIFASISLNLMHSSKNLR